MLDKKNKMLIVLAVIVCVGLCVISLTSEVKHANNQSKQDANKTVEPSKKKKDSSDNKSSSNETASPDSEAVITVTPEPSATADIPTEIDTINDYDNAAVDAEDTDGDYGTKYNDYLFKLGTKQTGTGSTRQENKDFLLSDYPDMGHYQFIKMAFDYGDSSNQEYIVSEILDSNKENMIGYSVTFYN